MNNITIQLPAKTTTRNEAPKPTAAQEAAMDAEYAYLQVLQRQNAKEVVQRDAKGNPVW